MREFTKGALITVVDDNDRRISEYISNGWKERTPTPKPKDEADRRIGKAIEDVNASENKSDKNGKGKKTATDKKVNDALSATASAVRESAVIDDGLFNNGGVNNG